MKTFKIKTVLLLAFISLSGITFSQPMGPPPKGKQAQRQEKKENIEAMKVAFITSKLDLTPEEAQKFWPVYNQFTEKMHELRKKRRQDEREAKQNFEEMTDKEAEQAIDNDLAVRQKELDLQKEYNTKFKTVLPLKKVAKLYHAEEQFKMVLLKKLKDKPER
ncbi:MAG: hypothetical protein H0X46_08860 [Bacteroidetes bacterium]|nr:hypothetical protein [Bacteroidota bacterium]